jgi:hypothetical protein
VQSTTEGVHNPHYFEWLFQQPHNPPVDAALRAPLVLEDVLHTLRFHPRFERRDALAERYYRILLEGIRTHRHLRYVVLQGTLPQTDHRALRHAFLRGECTQETMERLLFKREKRWLKHQACMTMWEDLCEFVEGTLLQFFVSYEGWDSFRPVLEAIVYRIDKSRPVMEEILRQYGGTLRGRDVLDNLYQMLVNA